MHAYVATSTATACVTRLTLDGEHGDLIWLVDAVPHTQVGAALRHHHVTAGHPLHIAAVVEQGGALLLCYVVEVQVVLLVTEQQVRAALIELLRACSAAAWGSAGRGWVMAVPCTHA